MFSKLVKYEFKKGILPYIIIVISMLTAFFILTFQGIYIKNNIGGFDSANDGQMIMIMGTFMLAGMTYLFIFLGGAFNFIQGIMYIADEVFRSKGYLTFSTPNSGSKILASKLVTYFIRIFIYYSIILVFAFIVGAFVFGDNYEMNVALSNIFVNPLLVILVFIMMLLSPMIHMMFIYFIMILNVTVIDFKHKILSSFLMYFIVTIFLRIIYFIGQMILQFSVVDLTPSDGFIAFYKFISINVPINIMDYSDNIITKPIPLPIIPIFVIGFGVFFLLYFVTCKLINKGINI